MRFAEQGRGRRDAGGLSWGKAESLIRNGLVLAEGGTFLRLAIAYSLRARYCLGRFFRLCHMALLLASGGGKAEGTAEITQECCRTKIP